MKKTALTVLLAVAASFAAYSQGAYEAWLFSENNYEGTARTVAMGNAFTALGGDLGAVTFNPASSAVAGYSQLTLTPSLTFSTNTAAGVPYKGSVDPYFQKTMKSRMTKAGIPNIGFSFNYNTGRSSGLKAMTFGFIVNQTNSWCEDVFAEGTNSQTSFLAAAAADATEEIRWLNENKAAGEPDFTKEDFMREDAFKYMKWQDIVGYRSGMFSAYDAEGKEFVAATEKLLENGDLMQSGEVGQRYGRSVSGNKYEYLFNFGANISDFVYVGASLGINSISYDYTHYFKEDATDPYMFENIFTDSNGAELTTYFKKATYKHSYSADGTGIFGKIGVIVTPGAGLRFGAAIQTPSTTTIKEQWQDMASTSFTDSSCNGEAESELGRSEYTFNSPWRFNFGLAYTLGRFAVVSADYEVADYGGMRYMTDKHDMNDEDIEYFEYVNEDIREAYGTVHQLRIGAEVKPLSCLAVRAGYNLKNSALKKEYNAEIEEYQSIEPVYYQNLSFGIGYSSKKSFFADLACRYRFATEEFIYPYSDYLFEQKGIYSPEIRNIHSNWKLLLTLGWRF